MDQALGESTRGRLDPGDIDLLLHLSLEDNVPDSDSSSPSDGYFAWATSQECSRVINLATQVLTPERMTTQEWRTLANACSSVRIRVEAPGQSRTSVRIREVQRLVWACKTACLLGPAASGV